MSSVAVAMLAQARDAPSTTTLGKRVIASYAALAFQILAVELLILTSFLVASLAAGGLCANISVNAKLPRTSTSELVDEITKQVQEAIFGCSLPTLSLGSIICKSWRMIYVLEASVLC